MQLIADLTNKCVIRMPSADMSAVGVALMAGLEHGRKFLNKEIGISITMLFLQNDNFRCLLFLIIT